MTRPFEHPRDIYPMPRAGRGCLDSFVVPAVLVFLVLVVAVSLRIGVL